VKEYSLDDSSDSYFGEEVQFEKMMYKRKSEDHLAPKLIKIAGSKLFYSNSESSPN
jgi:hypothetical protein